MGLLSGRKEKEMIGRLVLFFLCYADAIVNNAGILRDRSFARITDEDWGNDVCYLCTFKN